MELAVIFIHVCDYFESCSFHNNYIKYINVYKKIQCQERKCQIHGLRKQKKRSLIIVNEHFSDERNAEVGIFLLTLIKVLLFPEG